MHLKDPRRRLESILAMDAAVHSSVLLVSYSVELLLKAGLTRVYIGCSKQLFTRDVKRYGHNLVELAREVEYPLTPSTEKLLGELQAIILSEGRYPFLSRDDEQHRNRVNRRARQFWSDEHFRELRELARSVRRHVLMVDGDSDNPASYTWVAIDRDGYFAFRCGGRLAPRITVKYSSLQRANRKNNKRALKRLVGRYRGNPLIAHLWESARYRVVKV